MTLSEWFNSEPVRAFRMKMFDTAGTDTCSRCYYEEAHSGTSRRHRSNQKSVIFTKQAFNESFVQSPGYDHFMFSKGMEGFTNTLPIDLHIDLGNHCNLACKMCWPGASTRIATQYVKWGLPAEQYLGVDWTADSKVWTRFLGELVAIPKLKNIHFMGGEILLSPKFEELVDFMISHKRFDVNFSFVTNGTVYKSKLIEKLKQFSCVNIEISIETTTEHNDYIRQGCAVTEIIDNIKKYKVICSDSNLNLTLRPTISSLSLGYYYTLLEFALDTQLLIKGLIISNPKCLDPRVLPHAVRKNYAVRYNNILNKLTDVDISVDYNESDGGNYKHSVKVQAERALQLIHSDLVLPTPNLKEMFFQCKRWDQEFGFDMFDLYPEFKELYDKIV